MKVFHQDRARKRMAVGVLAVSMLASVLGLAPAAHAATIEVDCDEDDLVEAVITANLNPGHDYIVLEDKCKYEFENAWFDDGSYPWSGPVGFTNSALPPVVDELTIVGRGARVVSDADDEQASFRFLHVLAGPVTVRDLKIEDFEIFAVGGTTVDEAAGGCILAEADTLTLRNVSVKDCEVFNLDLGLAVVVGGAVVSVDDLVMRSSSVSGSSATALGAITAGLALGGGVVGTGVLDIGSSTIKGNSARGGSFTTAASIGGGIISGSPLIMNSSTVSKNTATARSAGAGAVGVSLAAAGGIALLDVGPNPGDFNQINNSTIDGNKAKAEGGIAIATAGGILNVAVGPDVDEYGLRVDTTGTTKITNNKAACEGACVAIGGGYSNNVLFAGAGEAQFNNTVFKGNVADGDDGAGVGGGLALTGDGTGVDGGPETDLNNASITKNKATGDFFEAGGGIFTTDADNVDIDESTIEKNKPDDCFALSGTLFCDF